MNPNVSEALSNLASQLGTSVEKLWPSLVAHAQLEATLVFYASIIVAIVLLLLSLLAVVAAFTSKDNDQASLSFFLFLFCMVGTIAFTAKSISSYTAMQYPEQEAYEALIKPLRTPNTH